METVRGEQPADGPAVKDGCSLEIRLFGPLEVRVRGELIAPLRTRKDAWLLALLLLRHDRGVDRTWLCDLLWPESAQEDAAYNLRRSLAGVRRALGDAGHHLRTPTPHSLRFVGCGAEVDLLTFDAAIARGDAASLETAVSLYQGPLLEGCFEEWVLPEREARQHACLSALTRLADHAQSQGDPGAAVDYLRRATAVDPLCETGQRRLMQALSAAGEYAAVKRVYRDFRQALHRELNADPDPETIALWERIQELQRRCVRSPRDPMPPGCLPRPLSSLVGRKLELQEIGARLNTARLLTLTGPGGVGKTRLAIGAAANQVPRHPDGVWFVELAPLEDGALLPHVVATALQIPGHPTRPPIDTLVQELRERSMLLVLDNCEHLVDACASLTNTLLNECRNLRILTTSRVPLGMAGEVVLRVPSLALADVNGDTFEDETLIPAMMESDAVRLFVERAAAARVGWVADNRSIYTIAQICRRLDGNALAIELAAARARALSVEEIAARLDDRFRLLTGGDRTALPRQQTLKGTLDWSYDLLTSREQILLAQLSVFAGDWTLEAAEAVNENGNDILELVTALVDKSVVTCMESRAATRYGLLETVRSYAAVKLQERDGAGAAQERHGAYFLALAEEAERNGTGPQQARWLARLELEQDNLRAALGTAVHGSSPPGGDTSHAFSRAAAERGLRMCGSLGWFWATHGHVAEGRAWCEAALERGRDGEPTAARAKALDAAGTLAFRQSDYTTARGLHEKSLEIWESIADLSGSANALSSLGLLAWIQGDYAAAAELHLRSLGIRRQLGDRSGAADSLGRLGLVAFRQGDYAAAQAYYEESLTTRRELEDPWGIAASQADLGLVVALQGDCIAARDLCEESLAARRTLGDRSGIADALAKLGLVARLQGDCGMAWTLHLESLAIRQELGDRWAIAGSLEAIAGLVSRRWPERAAQLWGAAGRVREETGSIAHLHNLASQQRDEATARQAIGEDQFTAAWAEGGEMGLEEACDYALRSESSQL